MYDIIGDIHGYADELIELLTALGYQKQEQDSNDNPNSHYQHPTNKAIFFRRLYRPRPKAA